MQGRRVIVLVGISVSLALLGGKDRLTPVVSAATSASKSTVPSGQPASIPSPSATCSSRTISLHPKSALLKRNRWESHHVVTSGEVLKFNNSSSKSLTIHFDNNPCDPVDTNNPTYYRAEPGGTVNCKVNATSGSFHYEIISPSPNLSKKVKRRRGPGADRVTPCKGCYLDVQPK
jgi:hypothetical protein